MTAIAAMLATAGRAPPGRERKVSLERIVTMRQTPPVMAAACDTTRRPNTTLGSATCCAMTSGIRVAANHAAATADTALTRSIAASHVAGLEVRRAMRVAAADPIASPLMNAAAIVANA